MRKVWVSVPELDDGLVRALRVAKVSRKAIKVTFRNAVHSALRQVGFVADVVVRGPDTYQPPRFSGFESGRAEDVARVAITGAEASLLESLTMLANQLGARGALPVRGKYKRR